jgi:uncharacterized protein YjbI with pentapeptide repeats
LFGCSSIGKDGSMSPQYGPHRWSAGDRENELTGELRGSSFLVADLAGATFRDCDLSGVKVIDSWLVDVDLSGYVEKLVVNGVDVTAYVEGELDRRHPERVQLRQLATAEDYRAMWNTIERLWSATVARAERLPETVRHQRVADEWSFVETMRHLVYVTDAWASRTVLDEPMPFHRLSLPQSAYPPADAAALGMDLAAQPSYAEVMQARADRLAVVRRIVADLADADLERACSRAPAPGYPEEERTVASCLYVVMKEECEHYRYAVRDLAVLEGRVPC